MNSTATNVSLDTFLNLEVRICDFSESEGLFRKLARSWRTNRAMKKKDIKAFSEYRYLRFPMNPELHQIAFKFSYVTGIPIFKYSYVICSPKDSFSFAKARKLLEKKEMTRAEYFPHLSFITNALLDVLWKQFESRESLNAPKGIKATKQWMTENLLLRTASDITYSERLITIANAPMRIGMGTTIPVDFVRLIDDVLAIDPGFTIKQPKPRKKKTA